MKENTHYTSAVLLDETHICVAYRDNHNNCCGTSRIGTISGDDIEWGKKTIFDTEYCENIHTILLDKNHICIVYQEFDEFEEFGDKDHGKSIIGTISGDNIKWNNKSVFNLIKNKDISIKKLDPTHVSIIYTSYDNDYETEIIGTILNNIIIYN